MPAQIKPLQGIMIVHLTTKKIKNSNYQQEHMPLKLKEPPHCLNCEHLVMHKGRHHCIEHWEDHIHPEAAGHLLEKLGEEQGIYEILCGRYKPNKQVKVK